MKVGKLLKQKHEADTAGMEQVLNVSKQLLLEENTEERSLLRQIGMGKVNDKLENERGRVLAHQKYEDEYKGDVYSKQQINALCRKYRLRFAESFEYVGAEDRELGIKLKNFVKEHNVSNLNRRFYVLAPYEQFNNAHRVDWLAPFKLAPDPALFYQVRSGEGYFKLVHSWGKDLTWWRLVLGFKYRSVLNFCLYYAALVALISCIITVPVSLILGQNIALPIAVIGAFVAFVVSGGVMIIEESNQRVLTPRHIIN